MRIGYVFGGRFDPVSLGGNAVDIREDLEGMRQLGHEVEFRAFERAPLEVAPTIRSVKSRIPPPLWDLSRDLALLRKNAAWRRRLLDDFELHTAELVFEYWSPDSFGGARLAHTLEVPLVLENLDPLTDERRITARGPLNRRLVELERARRRAADMLIVMSRGLGDYLVSHDGIDPGRVQWLPQGVNTERFRPPSPTEREAARARLGASESRIVGFVGSMATYQRVDLLVEAASLLRQRRQDVQLVLVGGTRERADAAGADDAVVVIPHVDYDDVPGLVGAFDVAVLPDSNWYGSPVKILEYAAVGVPIVGPDVGPVRDLVDGSGDCVLVAPGDPVALADAIEGVLDDPNAGAGADRLRRHVTATFARRDRTSKLLELCANLTESR